MALDRTWRKRRQPATGQLVAAPAEPGGHAVFEHGFVTVAPHARAGVHADGFPWLVVGDTAWAMPWRAVLPDVETYAADRRDKGFNAVLLMTIQPDMELAGPAVGTSTRDSRSASTTWPKAD